MNRMTPQPGAVRQDVSAIDEQARTWVARLHGEVGAREYVEFEAWFNASNAHASAFRRAGQLWSDLRALPGLAQVPLEAPHSLRRALLAPLGRARAWGSALMPARLISTPVLLGAGVAVAAAGLFAFWRLLLPGLLGDRAEYITSVAEVRELTLPDRSRVWLGARSELATNFSAQSRRVALKSGEAFFAVAKDSARPFSVTVGDTVVRALGTEFNVRRSADALSVSVFEGAVEVVRPHERRVLKAGQEIVAAYAPAQVRPINPQLAASWRHGRLSYEGASLSEIVADANRYSKVEIAFGSDSLREVRVTTSFRTDQVEEMLAGLAATQPILVVRQPSGRILLSERR